MRQVAKVLEVSRSRLHERLRQGSKPRVRHRIAEDAEVLESVRRLVDERPTYGYRRIGALLNRERAAAGLSRLNHKRIYRLMAQNGLLLQRCTGKPSGRAHDGQIIDPPQSAMDLGWLPDRLLGRPGRTRRICAGYL